MEKKITKGMILSAGLGTRLLPITERYPKPLVPVLNLANLLHTVALFKRNGITDIVINLFHLPERIEEFLADIDRKDIRFHFSKESNLLGTGGGVKHAESLLGGEPFVLANCDFISNLNLKSLIESHFLADAWASMALFEDPSRQSLYSPVGVNAQGELCSLPRKRISSPMREGIFTGVHVLSPEIFAFLEDKPSGINEVLYPTLMERHPEKARGVFVKDTFWFDTGDIPAFWKSSMALLDLLTKPGNQLLETISSFGPVYKEVAPQVWITQRSSLPENVKIKGPVVLGEGCQIEAGVEIGPHTVIGDRVAIAKGSHIERSVVLSFSKLSENSQIKDSVVFEDRSFLGTT